MTHNLRIAPSDWVRRHAHRIPSEAGLRVLDLACGGGRHSRLLLEQGHNVLGVDKDIAGVADLRENPRFEPRACDLETEQGWPLGTEQFSGVVVTNYLWRPILPAIIDAVAAGGVLIYETFALGNEAFGRPAKPDFLLRPGELLEAVGGRLRVIAYEEGKFVRPKPRIAQRVAALNDRGKP
ncbi:MAG: class I SAM-dependent methyltransferase [Alphaproteobacteria bacterium]|nr:class I SAM-dependent methyltransferase [Alphaproteobacteria bacterium]